jgi:hypothetical protein
VCRGAVEEYDTYVSEMDKSNPLVRRTINDQIRNMAIFNLFRRDTIYSLPAYLIVGSRESERPERGGPCCVYETLIILTRDTYYETGDPARLPDQLAEQWGQRH